MTKQEIMALIDRSLFATLGYIGPDGSPAARRVFCVWHRGIGSHLISTNTSSGHVRALQRDSRACLYFSDDATFEGVCLTGRAVPTRAEAFRRLLWNDGDEKYYPLGVDDPDYSAIEFTAERADFYRYDGKGSLSKADMDAFSGAGNYENGYKRVQEERRGNNEE